MRGGRVRGPGLLARLWRESRRASGGRRRGNGIVSEPLNFLLKSPTALHHPPPWANWISFSPFGFTQSPLQAGLPWTPPEPPKAQRAAPLPLGPSQLSEPRRRVSECRAGEACDMLRSRIRGREVAKWAVRLCFWKVKSRGLCVPPNARRKIVYPKSEHQFC